MDSVSNIIEAISNSVSKHGDNFCLEDILLDINSEAFYEAARVIVEPEGLNEEEEKILEKGLNSAKEAAQWRNWVQVALEGFPTQDLWLKVADVIIENGY